MTHICGQADDFAAAALEGFCLAHADIVSPVRGGVVRSTPGRDGKVAVVVGGGPAGSPVSRAMAGIRNRIAQTRAETGLPGSPSTGTGPSAQGANSWSPNLASQASSFDADPRTIPTKSAGLTISIPS